jgi:hypothetical protein
VTVKTPFDEYIQVSNQIFVFDRSHFSPYTGSSVARQNVPEHEERKRFGLVTLAPNHRVYVDRIDNLIHGPSSFEITDEKSGVSLGKFDLGLMSPDNDESKLLFNGQGMVYLHHVPTSVCFGMATRKFLLNGKKLIETMQPLTYLGADAAVFGNIKLSSSLEPSSPIVAALQEGAKVTVIGIAPAPITKNTKNYQHLPRLLIKTPLGLTGWYIPGDPGVGISGISITQCN